MTVFRVPLVAYGYVVERLRHVPIVGSVLRRGSLVAALLVVGAILAFMLWAATVAPQRVGMADLISGKLSTMQSWIAISGDLSGGDARTTGGYRYVLVDPAVPNATMNVYSDVQLPLGATTISGTFGGPREPAPVGYRWIGTLHADPVFVPEPGPPWASIVMLSGAALLVGAGRVSYPMFFSQAPAGQTARRAKIAVMIRRGPLPEAGDATPAELLVDVGAPVELRIGSGEAQQLRIHSVHTGAEAGELRLLSGAEPALRVRHATDDLTISFKTQEERDTVYAALIADAQVWSREPAPSNLQAAT
ncbi:MAG TPA: hypothetical protein VEX62_01195 [Candidatus Limnocylindrales bacterium]|nr:hypothetical protein [Candidatus Limnocylindrales bacterium]